MSYSFSVQASSKKEAVEKVAAELEKVVASQPPHEADKQAAKTTAETFIGLLRDPKDGESITVSMNGSLSWQETGVFTGANVSVSSWIA